MSEITAKLAKAISDECNTSKMNEEWTYVQALIRNAARSGKRSVYAKSLKDVTRNILRNEPYNFKVEEGIQTGINDYDDRISW